MHRVFLPIFAVFLLAISALNARADGDRVSFMHDITVASDKDAQDVVCFLCSIHIAGPVWPSTKRLRR